MCWWSVATPAACGSTGRRQLTRSPHQVIVPAVAGSAPERILISVDLPAPLAPSRPWTRPARRVRFTPRSATVPFGKTLAKPSSCNKSGLWLMTLVLPLPRTLSDVRAGHTGSAVRDEASMERLLTGHIIVEGREGQCSQLFGLVADRAIDATGLDGHDRQLRAADTNELRVRTHGTHRMSAADGHVIRLIEEEIHIRMPGQNVLTRHVGLVRRPVTRLGGYDTITDVTRIEGRTKSADSLHNLGKARRSLDDCDVGRTTARHETRGKLPRLTAGRHLILGDQGHELGIDIFERASPGVTDLGAHGNDGNTGSDSVIDPTLRDDGVERHQGNPADLLPYEIVDVVGLLLHAALRIQNSGMHASLGRRVLKSLGNSGSKRITQSHAGETETHRGSVRRLQRQDQQGQRCSRA